MSMDTFPFKPFDHPPLSADAAAGPSSAPQPGTRRRQRRRGGGVKLSTDPQSVAARERRHRISHRFKILQSLVPGGSKMDTVSMLEEAIHYVKFLQEQISLHHSIMATSSSQEANPAAAFAAPAGVAAGAPPSAALIPPSYYGARVASISSSTESSLLLPQEAFSYPLPSFPPLPSRPAYAYQEEDEQLFPDLWFDNDC